MRVRGAGQRRTLSVGGRVKARMGLAAAAGHGPFPHFKLRWPKLRDIPHAVCGGEHLTGADSGRYRPHSDLGYPMPPAESACTTRPLPGTSSRWLGVALTAFIAVLWPCPNALAEEAAIRSAKCGVQPAPDEVVSLVNATRARGAACSGARVWPAAEPLAWSFRLAEVAALHSREMAMLDRLAHHDSHQRGLAERLRNHGYAFSSAAENVAVGYASLDAVIDAWLASESHCINMMNPAVLELGVACVDGEKSGDPVQDRYWTMVVGKPKPMRTEAIQSALQSKRD